MNDLIYKEAAIATLEKYKAKKIENIAGMEILFSGYNKSAEERNNIINACISEIEGLPDAQRWIPVSERLPENNNTVLITHRGGVSFGWFNGCYWERGASTNHKKLQTVVAWMPLPDPYKEDNNELD